MGDTAATVVTSVVSQPDANRAQGGAAPLTGAPLPGRRAGFRRCSSTPTLRDYGRTVGNAIDHSGRGLEVFVVQRCFTEFGGTFFQHRFWQDLGVCHYMTVFKDRDGNLTQFDFGPTGGRDIHVCGAPLGNTEAKSKKAPRGTRNKRRVAGEIRETKLVELPPRHVLIGRTHLSLQDIRSFNDLQLMHYELQQNDCRHYVNKLVQYTTGLDSASAYMAREAYKTARTQLRPQDALVGLGHYLTDVSNWPRVKAISQATMALAAAVTGRATLVRLRPAPHLLPAMPAKAGLLPAAKAQLARRPVYGAATAAVATYAAAATDVPVVREAVGVGTRVGEGIRRLTASAALFAGNMGRAASNAGATGLSKTVQLAASAAQLTMASAAAATRGAAGTFTAKRREAVSGSRFEAVSVAPAAPCQVQFSVPQPRRSMMSRALISPRQKR